MIVFGGARAGVAMLGFFLLLVLLSGGGRGSGGLLVLLVFVGMFVVLPVLFIRGVLRSSRRVLQGPFPPAEVHGYEPAPAPQPVHAAEVEQVVSRLAHDVRTLQPDDPVARQAMADAAERYSTATGLLERARSQDQLRTAWLAAAEGLHATRLVRQRLGLDPGPAPALPPAPGPQLQRPERVVVDGREHVGQPAYAPGYGHWFPGGHVGGRYVPGGWYADAFWPGGMVLGALSGFALGSLVSGAVFGGLGGAYGYDEGWGDGGGGWGDGGDGAGGGWSDGGGGWGDGGGGWGDGGGFDGGGDFGGGDW